MEQKQNPIKHFWKFLNEDTWQSWIISLALIIILIKFVFFPLLTLFTGAQLPLVVVDSCSMYHQGGFDDWWFRHSTQYENLNIEKETFESFPLKNGFSKGDIMFVWARSEIKLGDVIIFVPNAGSTARHPIIHRVISTSPLTTKGDNNQISLNGNNIEKLDERDIKQEQIIGKAVIKIPKLGWIKIIFFEIFKRTTGLTNSNEPWFCS